MKARRVQIATACLVLLAAVAPAGPAAGQTQAPPPVPMRAEGAYKRDCSACRVDAGQLYCRCENRQGRTRQASLDLTQCPVEDKGYVRIVQVENWDGDLRCGK